MNLASRVLGQTTVNSLQERISVPVLMIGTDHFTRGDLSQVDCFNFIAAATLNSALKHLDVKNTKDLFTNYPPSVFALPRIGAIALAVIGAAFEAKRIGGSNPLEAWVAKHNKDGMDGITTFHTIKHRLQREQAQEKKAKRQRKADRKNQAHQIRTERFLEKAADTL